MKKILLLFLTLISINSTFAYVYYDFEVDGLYYKINPDGNTVSVVNPCINDLGFATYRYTGDIVIPETVKNFKVTEIASQTFMDAGIRSIVIPSTIRRIGDYAFIRCKDLTTIKIPDSVTYIGSNVFYGCSGLTTIKIPDSVMFVGDYTFSNCTGLESVTLPKSLKVIYQSLFKDCTNLSTVTIPSSLERIGYRAFFGCSKLKSIFIPRSVTGIDGSAFDFCSQLKSVIVEYSSTDIEKIIAPCLSEHYPGIFCGAAVEYLYMGRNFELGIGESLKTVEFGEGMVTINSIFSKCTNLETIIIPETTISICDDVFQNCGNISTIYVRNPEPPVLDKNTFSSNTYSKAELHIPKGTMEKYLTAPFWSSFDNIIDDAEMCGIEDITSEDPSQEVAVYNLQGQFVLRTTDAEHFQTLSPGIYIKVTGNKAEKFVIR